MASAVNQSNKECPICFEPLFGRILAGHETASGVSHFAHMDCLAGYYAKNPGAGCILCRDLENEFSVLSLPSKQPKAEASPSIQNPNVNNTALSVVREAAPIFCSNASKPLSSMNDDISADGSDGEEISTPLLSYSSASTPLSNMNYDISADGSDGEEISTPPLPSVHTSVAVEEEIEAPILSPFKQALLQWVREVEGTEEHSERIEAARRIDFCFVNHSTTQLNLNIALTSLPIEALKHLGQVQRIIIDISTPNVSAQKGLLFAVMPALYSVVENNRFAPPQPQPPSASKRSCSIM